MDTISIDRRGAVALIKLDRGVTNPLNLACALELGNAIDQARKDPGVRSVVLSSANDKFFSIGFDIPELFEQDQDGFMRFYRAINRTCLALYTLPKPVVAAITGHAIAGGCILALCCDYRFISEGRKLMGLNEIKLGVPVPYLADRVLHALVGTRYAREIMESGEFYPPEEGFLMGLVDEILPPDQVVDLAIAKAEQMGALPTGAYALIKRNRVEDIETQVLARGEQQEQAMLDCWYSADGRERLREAMAKF
jgi:enoyl-CoA hydratase/carnithine racemase